MTEQSATAVAPIDEAVDHVRGSARHVILEYGDYECPYSRAAYREIQRVERELRDGVRFAFRHFLLTQIHPHALAASAAAEAAALQDRFWEMHETRFNHRRALEDNDLRRYATKLDLDVAQFDRDRLEAAVLRRIGRDVESGLASRQVRGTTTPFIDGVLHRDGHSTAELVAALTR
jgi:protein-disulfide isomerase